LVYLGSIFFLLSLNPAQGRSFAKNEVHRRPTVFFLERNLLTLVFSFLMDGNKTTFLS
jgi:uncharacterized membrane-anchored protein